MRNPSVSLSDHRLHDANQIPSPGAPPASLTARAAAWQNWADTTLMDNIRGNGQLEVMPPSQHWTS